MMVSGLPRSGTSMMMQMIVAGGVPALTDEKRPCDEDNPRGYFEFEPAKRTRDDASWLQHAPGRVVKLVHLLLLSLPAGYTYRVVMMRRDLEEVLRSQAVMLERQGKKGAAVSSDILARTYKQQLEGVEQMVAKRPDITMIDVDYADVIASPRAQAERVSVFLGGLDVDAMVDAVDTTLYRQRGGG